MLRTPYFSTTIYLEMGIKSFCNVSVIEPFFFNRLKLFWELCFLLTRYIPFSLFPSPFLLCKGDLATKTTDDYLHYCRLGSILKNWDRWNCSILSHAFSCAKLHVAAISSLSICCNQFRFYYKFTIYQRSLT